jgi:hypothetical protein
VEGCRKQHGGLNDNVIADVDMKPEFSPIDRIGEDLGFSDDDEESTEKLRLLVVSHLSDIFHHPF